MPSDGSSDARLVAVSAGDSFGSKARALAAAAIDLHGAGTLVDLVELSADGLLGLREDRRVVGAVQAVRAADVLVIATSAHRPTCSPSITAFFDRLPAGGLHGVAVVFVVVAAAPQHILSLDAGLRSLVAGAGGWSNPSVVYATAADFVDGQPTVEVRDELRDALADAGRVASALTLVAST